MPGLKEYISLALPYPDRLTAVKDIILAAGQIIAVTYTEALYLSMLIWNLCSLLVDNPDKPVSVRVIFLQVFINILGTVGIILAKKALTEYPVILNRQPEEKSLI